MLVKSKGYSISLINMKAIKNNENSHLLVAAGKSSRLDAIRKKAGLQIAETALQKKPKPKPFATGLNQVTKQALQQAELKIETTIESIVKSYPAGKQKTFFKLKYGVNIDNIKGLLIKDIFKKLALDTYEIKHFNLIENLYLDGKTADAE